MMAQNLWESYTDVHYLESVGISYRIILSDRGK